MSEPAPTLRRDAERHRQLLLRTAQRDDAWTALTWFRMTPLVAGPVARAVSAGQLPAGTTPGDFAAAHLMVGSVMDAFRAFAPHLWRRALATARAGLRHAELPGLPPDETVIRRLCNDENNNKK